MSLDDEAPQDGRAGEPCNPVSAAGLAIWGKSPRGGQPAHQLLAHLLDAAACTLALLEREPESSRRQLGKDFGLPTEAALRWAALLCALHDLGKATPAFLLDRGYLAGDDALRAAGLLGAASRRPELPLQHGQLTQEIAPQFLAELGWQRLAARRAAEAVGAHRGKPSPRTWG